MFAINARGTLRMGSGTSQSALLLIHHLSKVLRVLGCDHKGVCRKPPQSWANSVMSVKANASTGALQPFGVGIDGVCMDVNGFVRAAHANYVRRDDSVPSLDEQGNHLAIKILTSLVDCGVKGPFVPPWPLIHIVHTQTIYFDVVR